MNWRKWLDGFVLAGKGILLATKEKRFWCGFAPSFLLFGLLMNLLSGGLTKFELIRLLGFPDGLRIIGESLLGIFGVNQPFLDWLPVFAISLLQGILIGLIVLLWQKKKAQNAANLEKAGIITGLIALGAGCPTCGTTLLTPLIGAFVSTGSLAIAGTISTIVTVLAIIIAILSLKRLGEETYVKLINERYLKNHPTKARPSTTTVESAKNTKSDSITAKSVKSPTHPTSHHPRKSTKSPTASPPHKSHKPDKSHESAKSPNLHHSHKPTKSNKSKEKHEKST